MVPYTNGLSENMKNICSKHRIQMYFRGGRIIKNLPVTPKDEDHFTKMNGVIYRCKCDRVKCDKYIGQYSKSFGEEVQGTSEAPILNI